MSNASQVIVLAEDQRQQRFIQRFLRRMGYSTHQVDVRSAPKGQGSGEQWVRQRYPNAVRDYRTRTRSAKAQTALVMALDADTGTVDNRLGQLQTALNEANLAPRAPGEAIVHLIPRRNIETWILCLNGEHVDEAADYRNRDIDDQIADAAAAFFDWSRPNTKLPDHCIPSLLTAIQEIRRLQ